MRQPPQDVFTPRISDAAVRQPPQDGYTPRVSDAVVRQPSQSLAEPALQRTLRPASLETRLSPHLTPRTSLREQSQPAPLQSAAAQSPRQPAATPAAQLAGCVTPRRLREPLTATEAVRTYDALSAISRIREQHYVFDEKSGISLPVRQLLRTSLHSEAGCAPIFQS